MVELRLGDDEPMWDQPEVHEVYRRWHKILDEYDGDRMAVAEAWTPDARVDGALRAPRRARPGVQLLLAAGRLVGAARSPRSSAAPSTATEPVGASPTWVLSNHDVVRHPTRYGGGERGLARARAATLTMLALPGSAYLYQGEELGLEEVDVAPEHRQDPAWFRTGEPGRDGCRVPIPWSGDAAAVRLRARRRPAVDPAARGWGRYGVSTQTGAAGSTLELYRKALKPALARRGGRGRDRAARPRRARAGRRRPGVHARGRQDRAQLREGCGAAPPGGGADRQRTGHRCAPGGCRGLAPAVADEH